MPLDRQITYLLFMKRLNKLDKEQPSAAEFIKGSYTSRFEGVKVKNGIIYP